MQKNCHGPVARLHYMSQFRSDIAILKFFPQSNDLHSARHSREDALCLATNMLEYR